MKNKYISAIVELSKKLKDFINNNSYKYIKRFRKTNIIDGFAFKIIQAQKDMSQEKATYVLNSFKKSKTKTEIINRSSFVDREKQLTVDFYKSVYDIINGDLNILYNNYDVKQVFAVDMTQINLSKSIANDGLKLNKNKLSVNGFTLGIYNILNNYPVTLELVTHKNERKAFIDFIKNKNQFKGNIFVFDRGYYSDDFIDELQKLGIMYVCRLRKNIKIIPKDSDDKILYKNDNPIRIVNYKINNTDHYIATNLIDRDEFTINSLKELYHKRWTVEEFFKYIKQNMDTNHINEKTYNDIRKSMYSYMIISRMVDVICLIKGQHPKSPNEQINKAVLTKAIYDDLILRFIYCYKLSTKILRNFIQRSAIYCHSQKGKSYARISTIPYTKWYVKKYYHKYILENKKKINKDIDISKVNT